jgi:hypothetical protein
MATQLGSINMRSAIQPSFYDKLRHFIRLDILEYNGMQFIKKLNQTIFRNIGALCYIIIVGFESALH